MPPLARKRVVVSLAVVALCSCAGTEEKTLRIVLRTPPLSLDPQTTDDNSTLEVLGNVYEPLVRFDADLKLVPHLAARWTNPNETTWRFELRRDVTFQGGRPLSARDVKFTLDRALRHPESWVKSAIPLAEKALVRDDHTIDIVTRGPAALLLNQLTEVMVLPQGSEDSLGKRPNGTGPYRLVHWVAKRRAELERFDGYWGPKPRWSRATFQAEPDGRARIDAVLRGAADIGEAPAIDDVPRLLATPGARLLRHPGLRVAILGFNLEPSPGNPFAEASVRQAASLALDRKAIIREALSGLAAPVSQLAPAPVFGYLPDMPPLEQDLGAAHAALGASRLPGGFEEVLYFTERDRRVASMIVRQAAAVGIRFEPKEVAWEELDRLMMARRARAYVFVMTFPSVDATDLLLTGFHTPSEDRRYGMLNFSAYSDREMDCLIEESDRDLNYRSRLGTLRRAMEKAVAADAWLPLCAPDTLFAVRRGLTWSAGASGRIDLREIAESNE